MKTNIIKILCLIVVTLIFSCTTPQRKVEVDRSRHVGLKPLETTGPYHVIYSEGQMNSAKTQDFLVKEAYSFLSGIMGPKMEFYLLVVAGEDWEKNAYSAIRGMPEYYKGNLIVGAGQNDMASGYEEVLRSFPEAMTSDLIKMYTNNSGEFDMRLFFDKLSIHELTHNFQDPTNQEGYSMSRWLEELHANMGLYAFYKSKRPNELKYINTFVDFTLDNPPPNMEYNSLSDFDAHYYEMEPGNYGFYQMKFTKAAQMIIDSLGNDVLRPLNDFIVKYDESWKDKMTKEDFRKRLASEVDPYLAELIETW